MQSIKYTYDPALGKGLLSQEKNLLNSTSKTYKYDDKYRLTEQTDTVGTEKFTTKYTYGSNDHITQIEYPNQYKVINEYQNGYLITVKRNDGFWIWHCDSVNELNQYSKYTMGMGNYLTYRFVYNSNKYLQSMQVMKSGTTLRQQFNYSFTTAGLLQSRSYYNGTTTQSETFAYDNLQRLTQNIIGTKTYPVAYADNGNITGRNNQLAYQYNATQPHAVSTITGEPTALKGQTVDYTAFNKVSILTDSIGATRYQMLFTYNADRQRCKTMLYKQGTLKKTKYYANGMFEKELYADTTKTLSYITADDGLCAIYETIQKGTGTITGKLYFIAKDHLGSIVGIYNTDCTLKQDLSYDAWGRRRVATNWKSYAAPAPYFARGFTGHEHHEEFKLINMNGRVYDPLTARFLSPDNFVQAPGNTQSFNRYSYCLNNPLKYTDPSGNKWWEYLIPVYGGMKLFSQPGFNIASSNGYNKNDWQYWASGYASLVINGCAIASGIGVGASSIPFASTLAVVAGSSTSSFGMNLLSGGKTDFNVSFGIGSYNFTKGELRGLWDWKNLSTSEKIGYSLGALANLSDIVSGIDYFAKIEDKIAAKANARMREMESRGYSADKLDPSTLHGNLGRSYPSYFGKNPKMWDGSDYFGQIPDWNYKEYAGYLHDLDYLDLGISKGAGYLTLSPTTLREDMLLMSRTLYLGVKHFNAVEMLMGAGIGTMYIYKNIAPIAAFGFTLFP